MYYILHIIFPPTTFKVCVLHASYKHLPHQTHRLANGDHTQKFDDVGMQELAHDGCLLEELHLIVFRRIGIESLNGYLNFTSWNFLESSVNLAKVTASNVIRGPVYTKTRSKCVN